MLRKYFVLIILSVLLTFSFSCIENIPTPFVEEFEDSFFVEKEVNLSVDNFNGSVTISKWNEKKISIYAEKKSLIGKGELNKVKIEVEKNGEVVIKSVKLTKNPQVAITYDIKVPENVNLKYIYTSNGSIEILDLKGDTDLKSSNGYIKITNHNGNVKASTSNGRIEVKNLFGEAFLNTSNGKIYVDYCEKLYQAETSNGSIGIKKAKEIGQIQTSNGRIEVDVYSLRVGGAKISTSNGSCEIGIKPDININIDAETSNGKIIVDGLKIKIDVLKDNYLMGKLNNGGDTLLIRTSNANIYLKSIE